MLVGAEQRRGVLEAVLAEEAQQLELGVVAGGEQAVDLEHELLADHDRGVGVALADRAQRRPRRQRHGVGPARGLEVDGASVGARRRRGADEVDQLVLELGVGERVVGRPAVERRDRRQGAARPPGAARSAAGRSR